MGLAQPAAVLDANPEVEGPFPQKLLLHVLRDVETGKRLPLLQKTASSQDFLLVVLRNRNCRHFFLTVVCCLPGESHLASLIYRGEYP